jgi:hypothetical protein
MHDDCNYEKHAESDYDKLHSLREVEPSSKVIKVATVPTSMALAKGFCEALI